MDEQKKRELSPEVVDMVDEVTRVSDALVVRGWPVHSACLAAPVVVAMSATITTLMGVAAGAGLLTKILGDGMPEGLQNELSDLLGMAAAAAVPPPAADAVSTVVTSPEAASGPFSHPEAANPPAAAKGDPAAWDSQLGRKPVE